MNTAVPVLASPAGPTAGTELPQDRRPRTVEEYVDWARATIRDEFDERAERVFNANATTILSTAQRHPFFVNLPNLIEEFGEHYKLQTKSELLAVNSSLELQKKSYASALDKCLRKNVLLNAAYPEPPTANWITSTNWIERLNDIARGILVCRYLDGPAFLARELTKYATSSGLKTRFDSQQNERGYYAFHFYVKIPVEIVDLQWSARTIEVDVEVQLSTQLQDVLRDLTHKLYEELRLLSAAQTEDWKWDFKTNRFKASYLGHTLHLLEGLIVELREATLSQEEP